MEKFYLSDMQRKNFSKATNEIYLATDYNHEQYPGYDKWFYSKTIPRVMSKRGEIVFYLDGFMLVGLTILKKEIDEKKICTFMILEEYRKKGYSKPMLEEAFKYLETETPLITIPAKRIDEFSKIISAYGWMESSRSDAYNSPEIIFNEDTNILKQK